MYYIYRYYLEISTIRIVAAVQSPKGSSTTIRWVTKGENQELDTNM